MLCAPGVGLESTAIDTNAAGVTVKTVFDDLPRSLAVIVVVPVLRVLASPFWSMDATVRSLDVHFASVVRFC